MATMREIEIAAQKLSEARSLAQDIINGMTEAINAIKANELPKIRRAWARINKQHDELRALVGASPDLFEKKRTVIFHGIRVGFQKGKGSIVFDDPQEVIELIQKHFPELEEQLIRWTGKPVKEALNQLDVASLRKLKCRVEETGDQIIIKAVDSDFDKMAEALMRDNAEEERVA